MPARALIAFITLAGLGAALGCAFTVSAWWAWPLALLVISTAIGTLAVLSGLGGGVLFVALVGGLSPFHLDFVRGIGLLVAISGALSAAPRLLKLNLASLALALPLALFSSAGSIVGALVGLRAPLPVLQIALGLVILALCVFLVIHRPRPEQALRAADLTGGLGGFYFEPGQPEPVVWRAGRLPQACLVFVFIGFMAGLFGLGAGWANVPALHLLMGAPLKISVATSGLLIGLSGAPAVLIYLERGALLPVIAAPSVLGMMLGARLGARLLGAVKTERIRLVTVALLVLSALNSLWSGLR